MDISEFEKRAKPRNRRSRLDPFIKEIFELHSKGFTRAQIAEFLAANGVTVTGEAVRQFMSRRSAPVADPVPSVTPAAAPRATPAPAAQSPQPAPRTDAPGTPDLQPEAGKPLSEQILNAPTQKYSYKQLQKLKEQK